MNKMEKALSELSGMDRLAEQDSPLHRIHPSAKLLSTVLYVIVTVSFSKYDLSGLFPMILWPLLLFQISGITLRSCFYRLRIVLPLVMAVGLFNPFFDRTPVLKIGAFTVTGGMISMLTLMLKGVYCLMASYLLMATTGIDQLCAALRKMHFPRMLVTLLLLTYRYVGVMTEELAVMTDAYQLRAPGQKGIHYSAWGSFLGQLLLRSMDRAEELYSSMLLRGYHGEFYYAQERGSSMGDVLYAVLWCALFAAARVVNLTQVLGSAVMR